MKEFKKRWPNNLTPEESREKLKKDAYEEKLHYLWTTWMKLQKYRMKNGTGCPSVDKEILEICGVWHPMYNGMENMNAIELLREFVDEYKDSKYETGRWLNGSDIEVYVRKRIIDGKGVLEIVDFEGTDDNVKAKYIEFIKQGHLVNPWNKTIVLCVCDQIRANILFEWGFKPISEVDSQSYYKDK